MEVVQSIHICNAPYWWERRWPPQKYTPVQERRLKSTPVQKKAPQKYTGSKNKRETAVQVHWKGKASNSVKCSPSEWVKKNILLPRCYVGAKGFDILQQCNAMCYHSSWVALTANWVEKAGSPIILLQPPLLAIVQGAIVQSCSVQLSFFAIVQCAMCNVQCTPIPPSNPALILTHPKWCMCLHSSTTSSLFPPPMTTCIQISSSPLGLEPLSSHQFLFWEVSIIAKEWRRGLTWF